MPYDQPLPVIEALLRRITGIRFLLVGRLQEAAAQVVEARVLLEMTPIDRTYQMRVDAEDQFEVFLLTEMQERFALGHELAHFLKEVDPAAFETFTRYALETARNALQMSDPPTIFSADLSTDIESAEMTALYARDLDPYAWYLFDNNRYSRQVISCQSWAEEAALAVEVLEAGPITTKEEVICDLLSGLAVALEAHNNERGWTAIMAAACSRLALSNLETILGIDEWVAGRAPGAKTPQASVTTRQRCLNVLLPQVLPKVLEMHGRGSKLEIGDVHSVMHMVENRYGDRMHAALSTIDHVPPSAESKALNENGVLVLGGFMFMRVSADYRGVNRTAGEHKFELGSIHALPGVYARYSTDTDFARGIDEALRRHQRGDWGDDVPEEDCAKNDAGLYEEFEPPSSERKWRRDALWSQYVICGEKVLVITLRDRLETQVLFWREYL
ncbi:hypothetical protein BJQ90_00927 [Arthrobacter sp. SO3]|nr:hypothetical protein [Arthrobacter sp. SO3]